jgi:hypothetical protein
MIKVYTLNKDLPHLGLKKGQSAKLTAHTAKEYGLEDKVVDDKPVKSKSKKKILTDKTSEEVENGISNTDS